MQIWKNYIEELYSTNVKKNGKVIEEEVLVDVTYRAELKSSNETQLDELFLGWTRLYFLQKFNI